MPDIETLFDKKWGTPEIIMEHASVAIDAVFNGFSLELDLTSDTLSILDHYVNAVGEVDEAILALLSASTGAYLGELLRRALDGEWHIPSPEEPLNWEVRFRSCPFSLFPVAISAEVITKGDVAGVDASFCTAPARMELLAERLEHASAIPEDNYYSFSGRLDAIELCVEFLTDVEQRLGEKIQKPPMVFGDKSPLDVKCRPLSLMDK